MTQKFPDSTSVGALRFKKYGECVLQRENLAALPSWEARLHPVFGGPALGSIFWPENLLYNNRVQREHTVVM